MSLRDTLRAIATFQPVPPPLPATYDAAAPVETYALAAQAMPALTVPRATWPTWDPGRAAATGYARLALIYRCVNVIAHALGTAKVRVIDEANDGEAVEDHPLWQLLKRPNPLTDEAGFWSAVAVRTAVAGFCVVEKERDRAGNVIGLWPLQSAWLKAKLRRDSRHDWEYRIPGMVEPFRLPAEDVLVFSWADTPSGSPYGMGPLEACLRETAVSNELRDHVKRTLEAGAVPMYGLVPEPDARRLTQPEIDALLDAFVARRMGLANAARPIYLQAIRDIKRLGLDFNELAYVELHDLSELAIAQAFGIPASVVQIRAGLEHSDSRANAEVDEAKLYRQTIIPLWTRFDGVLSLNLLPEFAGPDSYALEFDLSDIASLQEDRNAKAPWVIQGFSAGLLTQHMALRELGIPPPETPDYYLRGLAVEALPAETPIPAPAPKPKPAAPQPPAMPAGDMPDGMPEGGMMRAILPGRAYAGRYARAVSGRRQIARIADAREPSIRAYFRGLGERVLRDGLAATGPAQTYALDAIDWAEEEAELTRILGRLYDLAGDTAYGVINGELGTALSWDLANPHLTNVRALLAARVTSITDESRTAIQEIVSRGGIGGKTLDQIAADLSETFASWSTGRSMTVARTESMYSYGVASLAGYRESGLVEQVQLFDNPDHDTDPGSDGLTCAQRNGLVVPLADAQKHIDAEHPNGTLAVGPVVAPGEE